MPKNLYQVAVLVDAGYLLHRLYPLVGNRYPKAEEVIEFANLTVREEEKLFRVYYYDCPPFEGRRSNPIDQSAFDFAATPLCQSRKSLQDSLSKSDHIAFRAGILHFHGWKITDKAIRGIARDGRQVAPDDVKPEIRQKRVDMKISLDVAWLASKAIVDKIVLITADTDFVPAMKFARREGVQVIVAIPDRNISQDLLRHADEFRIVPYPPCSASE